VLRRFGLVLCLLLLLHGVALAQPGTVTWIYDGDTFEIQPLGRVRLLGIDTPESKDSERDRYYLSHDQLSRKRLRQIALEAKKFCIEQLKGQQVRLEFDADKTDKYQRSLVYLFLPDGRMLNRVLLEKGLASVFRRYDFRYKEEFITLEEQARAEQRGLWRQ